MKIKDSLFFLLGYLEGLKTKEFVCPQDIVPVLEIINCSYPFRNYSEEELYRVYKTAGFAQIGTFEEYKFYRREEGCYKWIEVGTHRDGVNFLIEIARMRALGIPKSVKEIIDEKDREDEELYRQWDDGDSGDDYYNEELDMDQQEPEFWDYIESTAFDDYNDYQNNSENLLKSLEDIYSEMLFSYYPKGDGDDSRYKILSSLINLNRQLRESEEF